MVIGWLRSDENEVFGWIFPNFSVRSVALKNIYFISKL